MIASAKEIDALNITLFNSCINSTNVHLCNYCTKIFVIVVNTCVCRRSVDNKAVILSFATTTYKWRNRTLRFVFLDCSLLNNWYFLSWNLPAFRGNRNTKNRNGTRKTIKDIAIFTHEEHTTIPKEHKEITTALFGENICICKRCFGHRAVKRRGRFAYKLTSANQWETW